MSINSKDFSKYKKVFFIGIGGVSMSSIALMIKNEGYTVSGSDRARSDSTDKLEGNGIEVKIGHSTDNVKGFDAVVYTAAIKQDNPELAYARENGIPCISRGEYLGWFMRKYDGRIGIAGTHGKSTTTAMVSKIMLDAGTEPTFICGADIPELGGLYRIGKKDKFIFEACEYKDSFLSFAPNTSVITNIELDHTDYFASLDAICASFTKYMNYADTAILNFDNENVRKISADFTGKKIISFGIEYPDVDFYAKDIIFTNGMAGFTFCSKKTDGISVNVKLSVPGIHNVYNAVCALCVAYSNGIPLETAAKSLEGFHGVRRRFEYKGNINGADVYDDYAHHPTEIEATLNAAKGLGYKKIYCVFQPHTYSRTKELFSDFAEKLKLADVAILADIYAAREPLDESVSSKLLSENIPGSVYLDGFEKIVAFLKENADKGDLIITVGAGDVYKIGEMLLAE